MAASSPGFDIEAHGYRDQAEPASSRRSDAGRQMATGAENLQGPARDSDLRIGMFLDHYPHPGGTSTAVAGLADAIAGLGPQVTILCQGSQTRWWHHGQARVQMFRRSRLFPRWTSAALREYLRENHDRLDLLVVNGIFSLTVAAVASHARAGGIPVVVSPFDPYHDAIFSSGRVKKNVFWTLIEKHLLQHGDAIQVMAASHGELIRNRGVTTPIIVVGNGVTEAQLESRRFPILDDQPALRLGHLGRLDAWNKGIDLLVGAVADVKAKGLAVQLEIAGDGGSDLQQIQQLVHDLDLGDEVHITGPFDGSSIDKIHTWDALVVSSRFDGIPQTALEAMVAGRPVICSANAGAADYVRASGCGLVIEPTVAGISSGIEQFADRPESWHAMGQRGRHYVESHLTWTRVAESALAQYEAVATALPRANTREGDARTQREESPDLGVTGR
jgi:glycosyltransferase involved in cell wall biosynthesis